MIDKKKELLRLIKSYMLYSNKAIDLIQKKFLIHDKQDILPYYFNGKIPKQGYLDEKNNIIYYFHGIGCNVNFNGVITDFDFLFKNSNILLDQWKIIEFYKSQIGNFPNLSSEIQIKEYWNKSIEEKYIIKSNIEEGYYYLNKSEID